MTSRGTEDVRTVLRSREADSNGDCGLPAVASVRARVTTETYETITESDFDPPRRPITLKGSKEMPGVR